MAPSCGLLSDRPAFAVLARPVRLGIGWRPSQPEFPNVQGRKVRSLHVSRRDRLPEGMGGTYNMGERCGEWIQEETGFLGSKTSRPKTYPPC